MTHKYKNTNPFPLGSIPGDPGYDTDMGDDMRKLTIEDAKAHGAFLLSLGFGLVVDGDDVTCVPDDGHSVFGWIDVEEVTSDGRFLTTLDGEPMEIVVNADGVISLRT